MRTLSLLGYLLTLGPAHRKRYDAKGTGRYRSQQHAPPVDLPPLTISIFSDGSALPRKIGQPAPPAVYGVVAVEGASLDATNHASGRALFYILCGRVPPGGVATARLKTTTNNLAELMAFTRGLTWANCHSFAQVPTMGRTRPVCMRYGSLHDMLNFLEQDRG